MQTIKSPLFNFVCHCCILILISFNSTLTEGMCASVFSDLHRDLGLPTRIVNLLRNKNIKTIKKLTSQTPQELLEIPFLKENSLKLIETALANKGLTLKEAPKNLESNNISDLDFPNRAKEALIQEEIYTVEDLTSKTQAELLGIRNLGVGTVMKVEDILANKGLTLKAPARHLDPNDISTLGLSVRAQNALRIEGINTIEKLISKAPRHLLIKILTEKEE